MKVKFSEKLEPGVGVIDLVAGEIILGEGTDLDDLVFKMNHMASREDQEFLKSLHIALL